MSNLLLLLFAIPIATIIISSVFETIIHSPLKIAAIGFSIFLIVTFSAFDVTFLIFVILYTVLSYISAFITRIILRLFYNENDEIILNTENAIVNTTNTTLNTQNIRAGCSCNNRILNRLN